MKKNMAIMALVFILSACSVLPSFDPVRVYAPQPGDIYDEKYAVVPEENCSGVFDTFIDENEDLMAESSFEVKEIRAPCTPMGRPLGVYEPGGVSVFAFPFIAYNKQFQPNRTKLSPLGKLRLARLSHYMYRMNFGDIYNCKLYAQTDGSGGTELNQSLSQERAHYVADYLKEQGVNCEFEIVAKGEGPACPDDGKGAVQFGPHRMTKADDCRFVMIFVSLKSEGNMLMLKAMDKNLKRRDLRGAY